MIALNDVTKQYPDGTVAVGNLTMEMASGEITVLLGSSGCGKTTTLRMINRLIEPTSGTIELDGQDLGTMPIHELRRGIGYVIQQAGLFPHRSVADNIATVPKLLGWDKERQRKRSLELIELVGLEQGMADRYPRQLSGGQQQRVGVARALAADPPVLLMDEPFGAVDPVRRGALQQEFKRLQRDLGKTVVFVTHDVDEAVLLGDRIAIMQEGGQIAQYGPPEALLAQPASDFVASFIGDTRGLKLLSLRSAAEVPATEVGDDGLDGWVLTTDGEGRPLTLAPDLGRRAGDARGGDRAEGLDARPDRLRCRLPRARRGARGRGRQAGRGGAVLDPDRVPARAGRDRRRAGGGARMIRWDWLSRNIDVVLSDLWQHIEITVAALALGAAIAFPVGLIAYRWRRSYPPILAITQVLYTIPSLALFVLLINAVGLGTAAGDHRPGDLLARHPRPQPRRGAARRAAGGDRRRHRDGLQGDEAAVRGRAAARAAGDRGRAARRDRVDDLARQRRRADRHAAASASSSSTASRSTTRSRSGPGSCSPSCSRSSFDLLIVGGGRLLTPWTRAAR